MDRKKIVMNCLIFFILICLGIKSQAEPIELKRLKEAYPDTLQDVSQKYISLKDGQRIRVRGTFADMLDTLLHHTPQTDGSISLKDLKCDNYEPFFRKMYGGSPAQVKKNLVTVYWMPNVFGNQYPLRVTTVNGIDQKIRRISAELEKLPPSYYKYLANPAGSFYWRTVKREKYLSAHSFGIAMDINSKLGNYWLWDWEKAHRPVKPIVLHNNIPMKIVEIFEQEGFLWGGRWYFYDTMHFEYRPEMFKRQADKSLQYNNQIGLRCKA